MERSEQRGTRPSSHGSERVFAEEKGSRLIRLDKMNAVQGNLISARASLLRLIRSTVIFSLNFDHEPTRREFDERTNESGEAVEQTEEKGRRRKSKGKVVQPDPFAETGAPKSAIRPRRVPANCTP